MATTSRNLENPPHLSNYVPADTNAMGRNFGILLGILTAVYLLTVNAIFDPLPLGIRFAKYLIIVAIVWVAVARYAASVPSGEVFKGELSLLWRIGIWSVGTLALLNIILSSISPALGFEQFLNEGDSFGDVMMNSFFVAMETLVMVVIFGFVFLQYYKRDSGSPED